MKNNNFPHWTQVWNDFQKSALILRINNIEKKILFEENGGTHSRSVELMFDHFDRRCKFEGTFSMTPLNLMDVERQNPDAPCIEGIFYSEDYAIDSTAYLSLTKTDDISGDEHGMRSYFFEGKIYGKDGIIASWDLIAASVI